MKPRLLLSIVIAIAIGHCEVQMSAPPEGKPSTAAEVLTSREVERLRPVVELDLKEVLKRVYNEDHPTAADLSSEFSQCRITRLNLGKLGPALLVEGVGLPAPNMPMLNIYLPTRTSYRKLVAASGFGPEIVAAPGGIPYLIFGGTAGVGTEKLYRYRYNRASRRYEVDSCDDHASDDGVCRGEKLPTFPYAWPQ